MARGRPATRHRLLDSHALLAERGAQLAGGFVALVLDPCWPERAQRRLILEAATLVSHARHLGQPAAAWSRS
jgi:hypothetical protein